MTDIHPLVAPWGRFGLRSFYIDAPQPAIIDTGVTESPEGMRAGLEAIGRRIEDVRWILLTHGHIDHVGGAFGLWERTGRKAEVVIHRADVPFLRSREAHVAEWRAGRGRWLTDPEGEAKEEALLRAAIGGEMEPTTVLDGGEVLDLGAGVRVATHSIPGHTPGAIAYVVEDSGDVFVGDAVQSYGAASGFPGYEDPDRYRTSLELLRDRVRPERLYLGHPYRRADGSPFPEVLDAADALEAIQGSIDNEARIRAVALAHLAEGLHETASPYSPFQSVADELGYTGDPTLEPAPFFTTMNAYVEHFGAAADQGARS
ncbi:MBL fold metallo-hydrolase [Microbacterium protaetiae]|uniref:MBL fold metallo-hydrolase n=1 Tax=Microbacterium protaetiae TaxID=2509458 RepID=A0A4V0YD80_9MICO|nr:MBL fold metallo-hydrolase [Microbacterium protaetiae]QAY59781.1 MBL fold metallo-hydrolase [Microbacterium protaetiae]